MIQFSTLGIPKGIKYAISMSIAFCLDLLIRNENITSEECKTKKPLIETSIVVLTFTAWFPIENDGFKGEQRPQARRRFQHNVVTSSFN